MIRMKILFHHATHQYTVWQRYCHIHTKMLLKPKVYASKIISEKELNRAIIDEEASGIVFGFKKFYQSHLWKINNIANRLQALSFHIWSKTFDYIDRGQ